VSRTLIVGLPRSGTTWLARTVARAPGVAYVHEPDNRRLEPLAFVGTRGLSSVPWLVPGQKAEDYRLLWAMAFAGGWPRGHRLIGSLKRIANFDRLPRSVRIMLQRQAARIAARRPPIGQHQVVKSVSAYLSVEWIVREFDPTVVVVWRHPLNIAPAWIDQGWTTARAVLGGDAVRLRFEETPVWPPPEGEGLVPTAWSVCARSVLLLETAVRYPDWILVSHEEQCVDPVAGFTQLFSRMGFEWTADVDRALQDSNRPGTGYATQRRWSDEPLRWKERLTPEEQEAVVAVIRRFEEVSDVAATIWRSSAAVTGAR
jgi:hypothetical protein